MENKQQAAKQPSFNRSKRITLLCLFCAAGTALSTWVAISSLSKKTPVMSVSPVTVPAHVQLPADPLSAKAEDQNIREIRRLVAYMDSLARSPGRHLYDSLLRAHPGLAENLDELKKLYPELSNDFLIHK